MSYFQFFLAPIVFLELFGGCGSTRPNEDRRESLHIVEHSEQNRPTLKSVLASGGAIFIADGERCSKWLAEPTNDMEMTTNDMVKGHLSFVGVDPEGYVHGLDYKYDIQADKLVISGEGKTAAPGVIIETQPGWATVGVASMCSRQVPVIRSNEGVYRVGDARWYLSEEQCSAADTKQIPTTHRSCGQHPPTTNHVSVRSVQNSANVVQFCKQSISVLETGVSCTLTPVLNRSGNIIRGDDPLDVSTLIEIKGLETLRITTIGSISGLDALRVFDTLKILVLANPTIMDVSALSGIISLEELGLGGTGISNLASLKRLTNLTSLDVSRTAVSDLSPIKRLTKLKSIKAICPNLVDIGPLSEMHNLEFLDISRSQVYDLRPLHSLQSLVSLNIEDTQVSDLSPLIGLKALRTITIGPNVSASEIAKLRNHNPDIVIQQY